MNELQPYKSNNSCLDRGLLVSLRDGELTPEETEQALTHLALCPDCAADARDMQTASLEVYDLLTILGPSPQEIPETKLALSAIRTKLEVQNRDEEAHAKVPLSAQSKIRFYQPKKPQHPARWLIVVVAAALIALIVLPNAGALANQFLALFSVQQFQPVTIDPQSFRGGIGEDLQSFGYVSIPGSLNDTRQLTQAQVEQSLNFKLLLPSHLPPGISHVMQFTLINSANATFTFNAAKARAYLAQTGQSSVSIPSQLDGATYTITVAAGVIINYGNKCQQKNQGCTGSKQFYIGEIPSPVIQATGKASLKDLRDFALSLPNLSSGVRLLLQDVDLNSGVVPLPIPPQVQAQQVTIHGVQGVLMTDSSLSLGSIIWQTHGIIYGIGGATSDSAQLLDCANSLY